MNKKDILIFILWQRLIAISFSGSLNNNSKLFMPFPHIFNFWLKAFQNNLYSIVYWFIWFNIQIICFIYPRFVRESLSSVLLISTPHSTTLLSTSLICLVVKPFAELLVTSFYCFVIYDFKFLSVMNSKSKQVSCKGQLKLIVINLLSLGIINKFYV